MAVQIHRGKSSAQLHQDSEYLRIETVGRRTGKPHQVLLRYIVAGERIVLFPQNTGDQDWVANLLANPSAKIYSNGGTFLGNATTRTISGIYDPILGIFTRKYGTQIVRQRYWGQRCYVELKVEPRHAYNLEDLNYGDIEAAFDGVAENYDRHILGNPINVWLRNISVQTLEECFTPGSIILELGCGTGTETLELAKRGVTVLACDISMKMLKVLERKAKQAGLQERIIAIHCRQPELKDRIHALGFAKIDGAYSTYGAINTEPKLDELFEDLHGLLKLEAPLVLGVWNKYCAYEIIGYLLRGKPDLAFARLRNPVPIGKSRFCMSSNSYSVSSLGKHLNSGFQLMSVVGVVILLPPSNLTRYLPKGRWLNFSKRLDYYLGKIFPFNHLGDHFLAVYKSKGEIRE